METNNIRLVALIFEGLGVFTDFYGRYIYRKLSGKCYLFVMLNGKPPRQTQRERERGRAVSMFVVE